MSSLIFPTFLDVFAIFDLSRKIGKMEVAKEKYEMLLKKQ